METIKVLLLEESPADVRLLSNELHYVQSPFNVQLQNVATLEQGLEALSTERFQTVLVDLNLPDSCGLVTLQRVLARAPQIPVIVLTGQEDEEIGIQAMQAGAQDYLIKGQSDGRILGRMIQHAIQRKQIEMQLTDAREFTECIVNSSPVGIFTYKLTGECLSVNAAAAQMVGTTIEQLERQNFRTLESWKRSGLFDLAERAIASKTLVTEDVHVLTTFGRDAWYHTQFTTFKSGGEEHLLLMFNDITEQKRVESTLREREQLLNKSQAISQIGSWELNLITNHLTWSDEAYRIFGIDARAFKATYEAFVETIHPDDRSAVEDAYANSLHTGSQYEIDHRIIRRDTGEIRFVHERCEHVRDTSGQIVRSIGMVQDITARKQTDAAVAAMQKRFQSLIEHAPDGIALLGMDGKLRQVTPSTQQILGYTLEEAEGQDPASMTYPDDLPMLLTQLADIIQDPSKVIRTRYRFKHKNGSWRWLESTISNLIAEPSVEAIVFNYRDITESKQADELLREKEQLLSDAERIAKIGSWSYDVLQTTLQLSDESYQLLDIPPQDTPLSRTAILDVVYPSDRAELNKWMNRLAESGQVAETDFRILRKNGELRYLQARGDNLLDSDGKLLRFMGTIQDITERKLAEIQIRQQISRLQALRRIDQAITSSFDQRFTLETILSEVISQLQVDAADIMILEENTQVLRYAAGKGFRTGLIESACVPMGESHVGRSAKEKRLIQILDLSEKPGDLALRELSTKEGFVSLICIPLIVKGSVKGILEVFHRSPLLPYGDWLDFLNALAGQTAIAIENSSLIKILQDSNRELFEAYDATIEGWSRAMDLRDHDTEDHTRRVTALCLELARAMKVDESRLVHIRRGALLHDIGKLGVPDHILSKQEELTDEEREIMQRHPELAYSLLAPIHYLKPALPIPYFHHEKWNGTGYPLGLKGEQIPFEARIFAVVDVWDALTTSRPYRPAWSRESAFHYINEQAGKQFDPDVVKAFLKLMG